MQLRPELRPPALDAAEVEHLTRLAAHLAEERSDPLREEHVAEFNQRAGTWLGLNAFVAIPTDEALEEWVRKQLYEQRIRPVPDVTRAELLELVRRIMAAAGSAAEQHAYMRIFEANVSLPGAANLIFYPRDHDEHTNTWGGGRPLAEYDPTPDQVVDWALAGSAAGSL